MCTSKQGVYLKKMRDVKERDKKKIYVYIKRQ